MLTLTVGKSVTYVSGSTQGLSAARLEEPVSQLVGHGTTVDIGGRTIYKGENDKGFQPYPFIGFTQPPIFSDTIVHGRSQCVINNLIATTVLALISSLCKLKRPVIRNR